MKNVFGFVIVFLGCSLLSCQDSNEELKPSSPDISQLKTVGMKIPTEAAVSWIEAYNERNTSSRLDGVLYSVNSAEMEKLLSSVDDLIGVAFQYGLDENGVTRVIAIPVDTSLTLWTPVSGRIYIDANTSTEISRSTAHDWALNYQTAYPTSIWFHYFGANIFDEIVSSSDFVSIDIVPALNILNMSPQLLLIVGSSESILGRTNTETSVYDASYPCPKCAVH
jgi:hypothetical protein